MKKKLLLALAALLVLSVLAVALVPWSSFGPPPVSHSTVQRTDCTNCHSLAGVQPFPQGHATKHFTNADCLRCHKLAAGRP